MNDRLEKKIDDAYAARRERRLDHAYAGFEEVASICRKEGKRIEMVKALNGLAQIERDRDNPDAALPHYSEAVEFCREFDEGLLLAHTIRHLGDLYQQIGQLNSADSCYREALEIYRNDAGTEKLELANAIRPTALLMEKLSKAEDARRFWEEAKALYAAAGVREGIDECTQRIKRCC